MRLVFCSMKLEFEESQLPYSSGSQTARVWTERWVRASVYCPNCGSPTISAFPNNSPVADFFCAQCSEEYELKSQKNSFGEKVLDGAYSTKCERLAANNNPNLFLLNYDLKKLSVTNLFVVPKHFFVLTLVAKRKAASSHVETSRMDWLPYPAQSDSRIWQDIHCSCGAGRAERASALKMEADAIPAGSDTRGTRLVDRGDEMHRIFG